jgi:hypothetical protein
LQSSSAQSRHGASGSRVFAFAATRGDLFSLGLGEGEDRGRLRVWRAGEWTDAEMSGVQVRRPLAMTFHLEHDALYVLDQGNGPLSPVRLLRVDVSSGHVTWIGTAALGGNVRGSIAVGYDGELVVAISRRAPGYTRVARIRVEGAKIKRLGWLLRHGELLAGTVFADDWGVHYLTEEPSRFRIRSAPMTAFIGAPAGGHECP